MKRLALSLLGQLGALSYSFTLSYSLTPPAAAASSRAGPSLLSSECSRTRNAGCDREVIEAITWARSQLACQSRCHAQPRSWMHGPTKKLDARSNQEVGCTVSSPPSSRSALGKPQCRAGHLLAVETTNEQLNKTPRQRSATSELDLVSSRLCCLPLLVTLVHPALSPESH